ncbi:MAG: hypothetical protein B0W54_18350 [Cellvibrio sp. 79]|nr:MAG: hypothetical protein B0W54_18350 [Cellvibrio sp. 79]
MARAKKLTNKPNIWLQSYPEKSETDVGKWEESIYVVLWITFAQQNHKAANYKLSSALSARVAVLCYVLFRSI